MAARLEITCQPETTTFRDEGGKLNYLFAFVILRCGPGGLPKQLRGMNLNSIPFQCSLEYEDGSPIISRPNKQGLVVYGNAGSAKPKEATASLDCTELRGSIRFKIMKLSRNHDKRRFRIKISLKNIPENVVAPVWTRPTIVLSKRKKLKAGERTPENRERNAVEKIAAEENAELAALSKTDKAQRAIRDSIRDIAKMVPIESKYPIYAKEFLLGREDSSVEGGDDEEYHDVDEEVNVRGSHVHEDDDLESSSSSDPDQDVSPLCGQRTARKRTRESSFGLCDINTPHFQSKLPKVEPSNSDLTSLFKELHSMRRELEAFRRDHRSLQGRVDELERENTMLRRELGGLSTEDAQESEGDDDEEGSKASSAVVATPPTASLARVKSESEDKFGSFFPSPPLGLSRSLSLGLVEGDQVENLAFDEDTLALFDRQTSVFSTISVGGESALLACP